MKKFVAVICMVVVLMAMALNPCAAKKDTIAPVVTKTDPVDNSMDIMIENAITVRFSETVAKGAAFSSISLQDQSGEKVKFSIAVDKNVLKITPTAVMKYDTVYKLLIPKAAVKDAAGNNLAETFKLDFVTEQKVGNDADDESAISQGNNYQIVLDAVVKGDLTETMKDSIIKSLKRVGIDANIVSAEASGDGDAGDADQSDDTGDDAAAGSGIN